jgi:16S rRNA G966 N2-methylase RsmD
VNVLDILKIENAKIFRADVFAFLRNFKGSFDFIFADPPFELKNFTEVPDVVLKTDILSNNGLFILEHPKEYDFSKHQFFKENRKYGKVNFTFFEK